MRRTLVISLLSMALLVGACGSEDPQTPASGASSPSPASFPATVEAANGSITVEQRPEAIVSLSPTSTEMLFAIGAGDQVVAVDDQSNYPAEAPMTDLSGYTPNVEAVASYDPDLVVIDTDPGDLIDSLNELDIPVIAQPAAVEIEDAYDEIEQLGAATGHVSEADELVTSMRSDIADIVASVPSSGLSYYHELDNTYFTATSSTFIGSVYSMLGLENIADEADKDGTGYPQLSAEYIIDADPDLIFLADTKCCKQNLRSVSKRPGWSELSAVQHEHVVELDDDVASRWGPRVVGFLQKIADAVQEIEGG